MRRIAGEFNPADLYTKQIEPKAKIEQLVALSGGEFRDARAETALQLRKDPAAAVMVAVLYSSPESSPGQSADMRMLRHLMTPEEMGDLSTVVTIDEAENQVAKEFDQLDI